MTRELLSGAEAGALPPQTDPHAQAQPALAERYVQISPPVLAAEDRPSQLEGEEEEEALVAEQRDPEFDAQAEGEEVVEDDVHHF